LARPALKPSSSGVFNESLIAHLFTATCFVAEACMDLNVSEGFVEVEGRCPILITALHGFEADSYRCLVKAIRAYVRVLGVCQDPWCS